jgi:predicted nucleotidyltransferase
VEFLPGVDFGPWLSHYFDFKDDLEELLGLDVDLLILDSPAIENTYFLTEVNRSRRLFYVV